MKGLLKSLAVAILAVSVLSATISCSSRQPSRNLKGVYHPVLPGQNLYRIALTYKVPIEALIDANRIQDPGKIQAGQKLFIPGATKRLNVPIVGPRPIALTSLPLAGQITSYFGTPRGRHFHTGIDIAAPRDSPIRVVLPGRVIFSGKIKDYGNTIKVLHDGGLISLYSHNERNLVRVGQWVKQGRQIATVGRSGRANGYHLHFEIRRDGKPVDPLLFLQR